MAKAESSKPEDTSSAPATPSEVSGYLILPILLPSIPSVPPAIHYLYLRRHQPKLPNPDDDRCIFVVNCPIDSTESHFRKLFSAIGGGRVERVSFEGDKEVVPEKERGTGGKGGKKRKRDEEEEGERDLPSVWDREVRRSGATAVVMFVDRASCEMSLKKVRKISGKCGKVGWVWGENVEGPQLGVSRYLTHHALTFPSPTTLQPRIDAYISHFTRLESLRAAALARMRSQVDEDGFTMVVRGGRTAPAKMEEAQAMLEKKRKEDEERRKGNLGFYRFQRREDKKEEMRRLVERFEGDRKRVQERKGRGKFRVV
ncbi:ribosomal RNA-processing protein 7-domain-containing protein [Tirmania nivea]|nr:ribosomal RNA-processing protein 7-domain-containing protein [Tirmania nivea]